MSLRTLVALGSLVLALAAAPGCRTVPPRGTHALPYYKARWRDLQDVVEINVQSGTSGALLSLGIWPATLGMGEYTMHKFGMEGRSSGIWTESRVESPLLMFDYTKDPVRGNTDLFDQRRFPRGLDIEELEPEESILFRLFRPTTMELYPVWDSNEKSWLDAWVEVNLFFVGARIGIRPREIVDLLLGMVTIDTVSQDDWEADA